MIFSIVDIETTGRSKRITEIAIFKLHNGVVIDEFTSLVNPQQLIPSHITALTGIDDAMVGNAPIFSDIAQEVLDFMNDTVFVAHSVNFDYNIIKSELQRINLNLSLKKICTVRLSRKLLPNHRSYSLGKLCKDLDISIQGRHRARGDAEATVTLLKLLIEKDADGSVIRSFLKANSRQSTLPSKLPKKDFDALPELAGIYLFKDKRQKVLYVGKAKNIKKRVLSHFYSKASKTQDLCREVAHIDFELSGTELIALLMEDVAIKKYFPPYNKKSKRRITGQALVSYYDRNNVLRLALQNYKTARDPIAVFFNARKARPFLEKVCVDNNLCPRYCNLISSECSQSIYVSCSGACTGVESIEVYNQKVVSTITTIKNKLTNNIIHQQGRNEEELAFVQISEGVYRGYGFVEREVQIASEQDLEPFLIPQNDNIDVQYILSSYLN